MPYKEGVERYVTIMSRMITKLSCCVANNTKKDMCNCRNQKNRSPICYNPQAARTILPITYMRTKLVLAGKSKAEVKEGMKAAVENKELPALEPGAMCYMMSKQAYLTDKGITQDGAHTLAHMMFYTQQINPADWGANMDNSPILVDPRQKGDPEPINIFMMLTGSWSDGSPAPLS